MEIRLNITMETVPGGSTSFTIARDGKTIVESTSVNLASAVQVLASQIEDEMLTALESDRLSTLNPVEQGIMALLLVSRDPHISPDSRRLATLALRQYDGATLTNIEQRYRIPSR